MLYTMILILLAVWLVATAALTTASSRIANRGSISRIPISRSSSDANGLLLRRQSTTQLTETTQKNVIESAKLVSL